MSVEVATFRPGSVDELSAFLREAGDAGRTVRAVGGGTSAPFGNLAPQPDSLIDMRGLAEVIDYSPVDLTIGVQAGITLRAIDDLLAAQRQRLVLDAANRQRATLGGAFASGLSGPRRLRFGSLKDFVIGVEVVTGAGEVARAGGMVVKNVSGYEMARLHYGAHGAFGIVTRLNLRVQPLPEQRAELQATYGDIGSCLTAAGALLTSNLDPAAVYATSDTPEGWTLHVQIEGNAAFVTSQLDKVRQATTSAATPSGFDTLEIDGASTPAFDRAIDLTGPTADLVARLSVPASQQAGVLEQLRGLSGAAIFADTGSGLIYVRCPASAERVEALLGGAPATTFLALPDELKAGRDVFGPMDNGAATVLRRVKQQFDPRGMFSPGRFALHL